jgi:hypothetical protein
MIDFKDFPKAREFEIHGLPYLRGAVQRFFGGSINYNRKPITALLHQKQIDVTKNPRRGVYIAEDGAWAIILGRVLEGKNVKAIFSLEVTKTSFHGLGRLLNVFEAALAATLSHAAGHKFEVKPHQFGDELLELAISKFFSFGYYDHRNFQKLIDLFHHLANIRFEGRNFTTGLLLTRSAYAFAQKGNHNREGTLFSLNESRKLSPINPIEKRFWYLADGQSSFFLASPKLEVRNVFLADSGRQSLKSFVDDYTLSKTLKGGDALFRVTSQSEFSVTGSGGIEFNFKEARWRVRNLAQIAELIKSSLRVNESFVQSFLYYVFYLSRRRLSSILWVPVDLDQANGLILSRNQLTQTNFSLLDEKHTQTLIRLLSSDGASIFDTQGNLVSFGSVIDISKVPISGVQGTGESVASVLGANGVAVKISQDGTIKLFASSTSAPTVI